MNPPTLSQTTITKSSRDIRQDAILHKWANVGYSGTLEAVTGFGKTVVGCKAIRGMIYKRGLVKSVLITVPRQELKTQWEDTLRNMGGLLQYCKVLVNNTAAKQAKTGQMNHGYDLCIHDEVHTLPAPEMQHILTIPRKYTLTLSATVERGDKKHSIIISRFPIFDKVPYSEALSQGWISPFRIYNIPVPLSATDQVLYDKTDKNFKFWAREVGKAAVDNNLISNNLRASGVTAALMLTASGIPQLAKIGGQFMSNLKKRKDLCIKNPEKINVAVKVLQVLQEREGILFSLDTKTADEVAFEINQTIGSPVCESFHSKKTTKERTAIINRLIEKDIKTLSTCAALDMGFDHPTLSFAIILSGFSSKLTNIQRIGRVVRLVKDKNAIVINLYSPNTQEEVWLNTRTEGLSSEIISIDAFINNYVAV